MDESVLLIRLSKQSSRVPNQIVEGQPQSMLHGASYHRTMAIRRPIGLFYMIH